MNADETKAAQHSSNDARTDAHPLFSLHFARAHTPRTQAERGNQPEPDAGARSTGSSASQLLVPVFAPDVDLEEISAADILKQTG